MRQDRRGDGETGKRGEKYACAASPRPRVPASDFSDLLGKTFKYGGRGPLEYDCYGLCMEVYRRLDRALPDFGSAVVPSVIDRMINSALRTPRSALFIELSAPEPWCLVLFKIRPPYVSHIGVVLEDTSRFIHIMRNTSVSIERLDRQEWKRRIAGFLTLDS